MTVAGFMVYNPILRILCIAYVQSRKLWMNQKGVSVRATAGPTAVYNLERLELTKLKGRGICAANMTL